MPPRSAPATTPGPTATPAPVEWKVHPREGYVYRIVDRKVVYQHREVLYAAIGDGPHACRHCGEAVDWIRANNQTNGSWAGILVVDHLDHDRGNNALENLAPSCQSCNMRRRIRHLRGRKVEVPEDTQGGEGGGVGLGE